MISCVCILYIYRERGVHAVGVLLMFDLSSCPCNFGEISAGPSGNPEILVWICRKDLRCGNWFVGELGFFSLSRLDPNAHVCHLEIQNMTN